MTVFVKVILELKSEKGVIILIDTCDRGSFVAKLEGATVPKTLFMVKFVPVSKLFKIIEN